MKKVCIVTATRAEYGLLKPVILALLKKENIETKVAVTGMHLDPNYGETYREIEKDNIEIDIKIPIIELSNELSMMTITMANALVGFGEYFKSNSFDLVVVLGDRYEMLAICIAAMNERIPIAHLHGGETTEGAIDEAIRHSITKMSALHFTSTDNHKIRVLQLGEQPDVVWNVGATGVENIVNTKLLSKEELEKEVGIELSKPYILITFHPETLLEISPEDQLSNLLFVCDKHSEFNYIITKANADEGGLKINEMLDEFAKNRSNMFVFSSLGLLKYLSAMKYCKAVVGNSSSGIVEVPAFLKPTINIGDRQKGRERAKSIIDCRNSISEIEEAFTKMIEMDEIQFQIEDNPYFKEDTSGRIADIIEYELSKGINLTKKFNDIETGE